jgi:hypothetical protein
LATAANPAPEVVQDPVTAVVRRQACATLLGLALSFADEPVDPCARATILHYVVQGRAVVMLDRRCCCGFTIYRRSRNPRPSKIAGIAFSIRAVRVLDCFAPAK